MRKHVCYCVAALLALTILVSCEQQPQKQVLQGLAQGSYYAITYYGDASRHCAVIASEAKQSEAIQPDATIAKCIDSIFRAIDLSVNLWVDSSIICRVNRNEDVILDDIFIDNFNIAQRAAELSGGYFDPTIGPLVSAWGFSAKDGERRTEDGEFIDSLRSLVDYRKVRIEDGRLIKENPSIQLDFNAIAQGYTSDLIGAYLESQGITDYLVDVGGEILARGGKPDGSPWVVGIEKPAANWDSEREIQQRVELRDKGIVTSGSYRKYVERDGKRYSHCIDPITGYPVQHQLLSATVIAETSAWADALASICMVMGMERSLEIINSLDGVEAYYIFVNDQGELETLATEGFVFKQL